MKGFPKSINTRKDVLNLLPIYPEETRLFLETALASSTGWFTTGRIDSVKDGIEDEKHGIINITTSDGQEEFYQEEFGALPNSTLKRLGMTIDDAEELMQ